MRKQMQRYYQAQLEGIARRPFPHHLMEELKGQPSQLWSEAAGIALAAGSLLHLLLSGSWFLGGRALPLFHLFF